jgi:hypothetical protein
MRGIWIKQVILGAVFTAATCFSCAAAPAKRIALVIGNSAYQHTSPLANPVNDAEDIAKTLSALGFEVIKSLNLNKAEMDRTLAGLAATLKGAEMGVFYYAGHGLQVSGQNYLVPVDAKLESPSGLEFEAVRLDTVQRIMENETQTNVLILDACRDNPLTRNLARAMGTRSGSIGKGLAAQESGAGTIISYSTQPGNVALDGTGGRNSPFAEALAKHLPSKGRGISSILVNVRNDVMAATAKRQVPWEHSALTNDLVLMPETRVAAPAPTPPAPPKEVAVANEVAKPEAANAPETRAQPASDAAALPKSFEVTVPRGKLVHALSGDARFNAWKGWESPGECTIDYATSDNPKMTRAAMKIGDYFDFKLGNSTYRSFLSEVQGDSCHLDVKLIGNAKAQQGSDAAKKN